MSGKKILLVTDTWKEQTNGVTTTLVNLVDQAKKQGDHIYVFHPNRCKYGFRLPIYKEIRIVVPNPFKIFYFLKRENWDHIHIATPEAPLGLCFSHMCKLLGLKYSISCHTKFPEFLNKRFSWISVNLGWRYIRYSFKGATHILTTTNSMKEYLKKRGIQQQIYTWTRGVNKDIFNPSSRINLSYPIKTLLHVGRISHEKNIDDFCNLDIPNTKKIVVGDGPYLEDLKRKYKDVNFVGYKYGAELAYHYANADVFVFTSKVDTFGIVIIESLACGTPVAAYPVTGPKDIIENNYNGYLNDSLDFAVRRCLKLSKTRKEISNSTNKWSWERCYKQFKELLSPIKE